MEKVEVLFHSSIRIEKNKIIYIDPFKIEENVGDADYIFITHDHYDHYSSEDIRVIKNSFTTIIIPKHVRGKALADGFEPDNIITVEPNKVYDVEDFYFETVPAYNIHSKFHPKDNGWVGYVIEIDGERFYIAGDTDATDEAKQVKCDIALVPVGGTYTMDYKEAIELVNTIKPKTAIPIHYGSIVGTKLDAERFVQGLDQNIEGKILMK